MTIQHRAAHRRFGAITQSANASVITAETDRDVTGEFAWIGDHLGRYAPRRRRSAGRRGTCPPPLAGTLERIARRLAEFGRQEPAARSPTHGAHTLAHGAHTPASWVADLDGLVVGLTGLYPLSQNRRESGIMPGRDVGHQAGNAPAAVGRHHHGSKQADRARFDP